MIPATSPATSTLGALEKNMMLNHCFWNSPHHQPVQYLLTNHWYHISQMISLIYLLSSNFLATLFRFCGLQQLFQEETPSILDIVRPDSLKRPCKGQLTESGLFLLNLTFNYRQSQSCLWLHGNLHAIQGVFWFSKSYPGESNISTHLFLSFNVGPHLSGVAKTGAEKF